MPRDCGEGNPASSSRRAFYGELSQVRKDRDQTAEGRARMQALRPDALQCPRRAKMTAKTELSAPKVLEAISAVMEDMAKEGISKSRNNQQQGYKFRGIDDVYNALSPVLAKHKLVITPKCLSREKEVVITKSGGTLFYVTVEMEFELASAIDGSTKTATMYGEAMDSADKATNKAMSAAYKYMAMQEFCIPTEGDNDADATTHEPVVQLKETKRAELKTPTLGERADRFEATLTSLPTQAERDKAYKLASKLLADLDAMDPERFEMVKALYETLSLPKAEEAS